MEPINWLAVGEIAAWAAVVISVVALVAFYQLKDA